MRAGGLEPPCPKTMEPKSIAYPKFRHARGVPILPPSTLANLSAASHSLRLCGQPSSSTLPSVSPRLA